MVIGSTSFWQLHIEELSNATMLLWDGDDLRITLNNAGTD